MESAPEDNERSRIQGYREVALILGMVLVLALPVVIERTGVADVAAARVAAMMGWFVVVLLPLTIGLAVTLVPAPAAERGARAVARGTRDPGAQRTAAPGARRRPAGRRVGRNRHQPVPFLAGDALRLASASVLILVYLLAGCRLSSR